MKRPIFLILSILLITASSAKAQRYYYFDHVTSKDGLSSNTIYSTMQDRTGFMWIGTRDGLIRYDGNNFINIRELTEGEGLDGNISVTCEDSMGRIWFVANSKVNIYNPFTGALQQLEDIGEPSCFSIKSDSKGRVWLLTNEIIRVDIETMQTHTYKIEGAWPSSMTIDSFGSLWVAMNNGHLYI